MPDTFLSGKGNYRKLIAFQKAECIYGITYYFAHTYLAKGDRTVDQVIQAAGGLKREAEYRRDVGSGGHF